MDVNVRNGKYEHFVTLHSFIHMLLVIYSIDR